MERSRRRTHSLEVMASSRRKIALPQPHAVPPLWGDVRHIGELPIDGVTVSPEDKVRLAALGDFSLNKTRQIDGCTYIA